MNLYERNQPNQIMGESNTLSSYSLLLPPPPPPPHPPPAPPPLQHPLDLTRLFGIAGSQQMSASVVELVAEREPILFDQSLNPLNRAIIRIQHDLRQGARLGRPIPTV